MSKETNWRKSVIDTAFQFACAIWVPTEKNICHGYDEDGVQVDTPDIDYKSPKYAGWWCVGQANLGLPYKWGGICTVDEYRAAIAEGKYAGNIPDSRDPIISRHSVGVDCSGLVTICWGLPKKQSTNSLLTFVSALKATDDLLPGDIFLLPGSHVMIFVEFADVAKSYVRIIDAARSTGKVSLRGVKTADLINQGYTCCRMTGK